MFPLLGYNVHVTNVIRYLNPTQIILPQSGEDVKKFLTYTDKSVQFQLHRLKSQQKFRGASGWVDTKIDELKTQVKKVAGWEQDGMFLTYSGLIRDLVLRFNWQVEVPPKEWYPEAKNLPWLRVPQSEMWPHQRDALESLLRYNQAGVSVPTGGGKSRIILEAVRRFGLKTIIIAPSTSICEQLYNDFVHHFGIKFVGMYGAGKKKTDKLITICVAQALARLEPDSEAFQDLSQSKVFFFDETHQAPAETFEKVCMGVAQNCPYRYFFSATHVRGDGSEMILKGITGPIAYNTSFEALVEAKILARPVWRMFVTPPASASSFSDPNTETRNNLYKNPNVNKLAADIANKAVIIAKRPTVIIIQEFSQFVRLYPLIKVPFVFAHGGEPNKKDNPDLAADLSVIPAEYRQMDTSEAIKAFNTGKVELLVGTASVATGVDLKRTQCLVYLQGGASETKFKQAIGRGTRMGIEGKTDCWMVDFLVNGSKTLTRHALKRKEFAEELIGEVQVIGNYENV